MACLMWFLLCLATSDANKSESLGLLWVFLFKAAEIYDA